MRRIAVGIAVVLTVLATACSSGERRSAVTDPKQTAGATAAPAGEGTGEGGTGEAGGEGPGATGQAPAAGEGSSTGGGAGQGQKQAGGSGGAASTQPVVGGITIPKAGKYVYTSNQRSESNPQATPRSSDVTIEYMPYKQVEGGYEVKYRAGGEQGTSTTTQRWENSRILMLSVTFSGPQGNIECKFNTEKGGLEIVKMPVKAEKFARQQWKNDTCEGWHDEEVVRKETVNAANKDWEAWVVSTVTHVKIKFDAPAGGPVPAGPQTVETTVKATQWSSPLLGTDVKSTSDSEFTFAPNPPQKSTGDRVLKSWPT